MKLCNHISVMSSTFLNHTSKISTPSGNIEPYFLSFYCFLKNTFYAEVLWFVWYFRMASLFLGACKCFQCIFRRGCWTHSNAIHIYTWVCIYIYVHIRIYTHTCIYMCVYINIYIYTHTHMYFIYLWVHMHLLIKTLP